MTKFLIGAGVGSFCTAWLIGWLLSATPQPKRGPIDGYWRWGNDTYDTYGGIMRRAIVEANLQSFTWRSQPMLPITSGDGSVHYSWPAT